jgi:hypothetical protein
MFRFGVYRIEKNVFDALKDFIPVEDRDDIEKIIKFISENCILTPNKTLFVKKHIRQGILPIILEELILTRIMIKNSCKKYDKKSLIYKILHNRQLGLKLLANVTYGYTSAGFSGRMPASEIGDSVVAIGRETLLNAYKIIEGNKNWNAKVIYGDTDSLFVLLDGRTQEQAILLGKEIAQAVTKSNPEPIKLQFEKIYCPMVLLSKKHYAGYKYEDSSQIKNGEKNLESKGIETVRRDTCEAVSKILQKSLKIMFEKKDLSELKRYLYRVFDKMFTGKAMISDFIFAKEVRLGTYRGDTLPPSAQIAHEKHLKDPDYLPIFKYREPYIVIEGKPGTMKLKDCVISPENFFSNKNYFLNCKYYIEKQILPAISRVLEPLDVDVFDWFNKYPRPIKGNKNFYFRDLKKESKLTFFNPETSSMYALKNSADDHGSKTIHNFFKRKSDIKNTNTTTNSKKNLKETNKSSLKFLNYNIIVDDLKYSENFQILENDKTKDGSRSQFILNEIKNNKNSLKRYKYEKICRFCSELDKYNISEEEVPCVMYLCKFFYEKLLLNENLDK